MDEQETPFYVQCSRLRSLLKETAATVRALMVHSSCSKAGESAGVDQDEMKANIMFAYRHLEDASMRIAKAIQAYDGGKSIHDENAIARTE